MPDRYAVHAAEAFWKLGVIKKSVFTGVAQAYEKANDERNRRATASEFIGAAQMLGIKLTAAQKRACGLSRDCVDAQAAIAARKPSPELEAQLKAINDLNQQDKLLIEAATKRLVQHLVPAGHPKTQPLTKLIGNRTIEISKCTMKRIVKDKKKAAEFMGMETFWSIINLPLKAIDDYLTKPQRDMVIETTYEDDRKLTVKAPIETEL